MARSWDKFVLLMWKNWVLQYRKPIQTIIEVIVPVIFSLLLVFIRSTVDPEKHSNTIYDPFTIFERGEMGGINNSTMTLLLSPNTEDTQNIKTKMEELLNRTEINTFHIHIEDNISQVLEYYKKHEDEVYAALDIAKLNDDRVKKITLRFPSELRSQKDILGDNNWKTYLLYPVFQMPGPRSWNSTTGASPNYHGEGFLFLQQLVTFLLPEGNLFDNLNVPLQMRRFPFPPWQDDILLEVLISFSGLIMLLSFVYTCINTVKTITTEKEKQLKEAMKIMGLSNWLHWTAWFLKTFIFLLISCILMIIILKVQWFDNNVSLFTHADPSVMIIFMIFYICATITFCFAISVFFSKANTAATISGLCWFLSYSPYLFLQNQYDSLSLTTKLASCLGSNTAMAYGFQLMLMYEGTGEGISWSNLFTSVTPDDNLSLGALMIMLFVDTLIYLTIAIYVEAVFPGEYGIPLPWYFPFTSAYWCGQPRNTGTENYQATNDNNGEFFETVSKSLKSGIEIKNLRKVFNKNVAVSNLCLNMYEDQITVLLGHNGAGKTTTMSMLTGMFPPTSGTAIISGYDIRTNMNGVRESLGLCPQHNIIFDDLTVEEHLYFFSKLKGMKKSEINGEIKKYIELLELVPKAKSKSSTLSGGMKRKLCVGMALCGNSKVVMLDEPTAGMDPSARRALWEFLQCQKEGRTMLLTTHFMDEADLLGDRIAIMSGGELQCCGSSFFLKKKYGAGYHLIMDKSSDCDVNQVTQLLQKHISNIEVHSDVGSELTYLLEENHSSIFEVMLHDLEENSDKLNIRSYGVSLTTLEEVFMKVGADHGQANTKETNSNEKNHSTTINFNTNANLLNGFDLIINQIYAMLLKRVLSATRSWILLVIQLLMPVVFLIIVMFVGKAQTNVDLPELILNLDKYSNPEVLIDENFSAMYGNNLQNVSSNSNIAVVGNITKEVLYKRKNNPTSFKYNDIVGFSCDDEQCKIVTAWFNNDAYHSLGQTSSLALSVMFHNNTNKLLQFSNYPLPYTSETKFKALASGNNMGFQIGFNIGFSMAFTAAFFILFIIRERITKSKHLQLVSGVKVYIFWLISFICDFYIFLMGIAALLITLICFQEDGFKSGDDIWHMFVILIYFGFSIIPVTYFAGFLFEIPSTGYTRMTMITIFTGVVAFLIIQIMGTAGFNLEDAANALHWVFLLVPHYSLSTGIRDRYTLYTTKKLCNTLWELCKGNKCKNDTNYETYCTNIGFEYFGWEKPGIGSNVLYSFLVGTILLISLLILEYNILSSAIYSFKQKYFKTQPIVNNEEDSDVLEEKQRIKNSLESKLKEEYVLIMREVTKYYKNFLAVNGISLGVKKSECFGLLGINGAGKTTTFKMMTGDVKMSYGDAWVNGLSIKNDLKKVQKYIGYCPQFDALLDDLTARESIKMFALLRGIHKSDCNVLAEKLAKDFDFMRHLDKKVKELSGGNKRKLSTSIALIGDPPVIYLDEPTTGMDPATKRYLWNALCKIRDSGKCIILTSHSMEECEALCTRLAVMVNGNFKCLGSTQHLKNKFAEGYTLIIKVQKLPDSGGLQHSDTAPLERFIQESFPGAILREKHQELLTYYITNKSIPWSKMFGILEKAKRTDLNIEDYSLGQSSLEQVFLTFTKHQREDALQNS